MITGNEPAMPMQNVGFSTNKEDITFGSTHGDFRANFKGLTIRQHFAAMAMQGMLSNLTKYNVDAKKDMISNPDLAESAVNMAEALIAELNKKP